MTDRTADRRGREYRRRFGGLRLRIVVGYVVLLASVMIFSLVVTRQVLLTQHDREVARALDQEVEELRLLADGIDPATGEPFADDVEAIFDTFLSRNVPNDDEAFYTLVAGAPYRASSGAPPLAADDPLIARWRAVDAPASGTSSTPQGEARFLAVPLTTADEALGVFVVVYYPDGERDALLRGVRTAALISGIALLVSAAIAWAAAGRVLRPVREITATARRINDADLSERIPVEGADELSELGGTFNDMLDRLEEGFHAQRRFLDDVAHELRTPITIAQGHLDLIEYDDPVEQRETIALVTDELERMNRYVADLLVLAKADRPDFVQPGPVDLGELVVTLAQRVSTLGAREWHVDAAPAPGLVAIIADEGRLSQAMLNLATNAVQHTGPGDEIGIGAELVDGPDGTPGWVRMWVRDTGPGVDPDVRADLFDRRTRAAASRERRPDGMGLGLSIVDAIARAHGGDARVESTPGVGAEFSIVIPDRVDAAVLEPDAAVR